MTAVLALDLVEVPAKVRTGGPVDDLDPAIPVPRYLTPYRRPR